ncbi:MULTISPECIES: ABC transporter ATP-binding protein [Capnocytophaga]|jgi:copper-transport ATP-binding protein nosF|uniref:ABC transporter ATP-binding protein n=1 Tax=Capnocytophaga TaxID=1016 RepID=UPI00027C40C2|nr:MULTISPECIES: ABC transporter ATP-binding protein [Capnocytophaga]EJU33965.1 ABC transporter, ATP-binding protein [Capnocytophaga sp. CM59]RKW13721.1 MAG: ABC transporter ATP-binding protein [Capnocytophaga sp.]
MIEFKDVHKKYGKLEVLKGVSFTIKDGGIFAILGPNGSGKTTSMKSFLGMVIPTKGDIFFNGKSIKNQWAYREQISYLPQIANFPSNLKVKELIAMIKNIKKLPCHDQELIELFGLQKHLNKSLGNLSGGTKQKVNLVLTFMVDVPVLVLDEPTSGLDPIAILALKKLILREKEKGKTILITSHILSFIEELSDEILFILEGNIYFRGTPQQLLETTQKNNFQEAIAELLKNEKYD